MNFRTTTIENLSAVSTANALSSKNFLLMSAIDTYNGNAEPTYQVYKVSDNVLLRGHKPTIVDEMQLCAAIDAIYNDVKALSSKMQPRSEMLNEASGYMLVREVANDIAKMIRQEDVEDLTDKFAENNEVNAVAAELYAKAEELAQEVMDYMGALGMALVTAHAPVGADADSEESATTQGLAFDL